MPTLEDIILPAPVPDQVLNFETIFGDRRPVEMEIGSGKGGFLLRRARALPERGFLGTEWANKFYRYAADRMVRWGVTNVRLMRTDAGSLVRHHLPSDSVSILHIYHPDPWPKKRHHKRRLIQPDFIAAVARILVPRGRLAIQTDHEEYFQHIRGVLSEQTRLVEVPFDVPEAGVLEGRMDTNFEVKYRREGREIFQIAFQKAT